MTLNELRDVTKKLQKYADHEGTEFGEMLNLLIALSRCSLGVEFERALHEELKAQLKWFKQNSRFKKLTVTPSTPKPYKVEVLQFKGEDY